LRQITKTSAKSHKIWGLCLVGPYIDISVCHLAAPRCSSTHLISSHGEVLIIAAANRLSRLPEDGLNNRRDSADTDLCASSRKMHFWCRN
jgi:hypothetical protein